MAKKKNKAAEAVAKKTVGQLTRKEIDQVSKAIEIRKAKAKKRGQPMTAKQVSNAVATMQATIRRQKARQGK